ncbi:MAG: HEAT repeat domain-containing protein [Clostridiales bacterium]|nr:HEAT repeat domain-containing protein [Clostridiales bacterium]
MTPSTIIIGYSLLFLLLLSIALFFFIISRRVVLDHQQKIFTRRYHKIEKDILEAIAQLKPEFSIQLARRHRYFPAVLTKVLIDYGNLISGEGKEQLKIIFDAALKTRCLKSLTSRWTVKRLKNARLFVAFFNPADSHYLLRLLQDKPLIRLATITALSQTRSSETLSFLFQAFESDQGYPVRSYFNMMFGLGGRVEPYARDYLRKPLSPEKIALLIELVGAIPLRSLYEDILLYASHENKEVRIRVARALGRLLVPDSIKTLASMARDEAWEVRAQAMKSLGKLGTLEALDILSDSLFSPFWHVRLNAASALAKLGEPGIGKLREIASQTKDRYAAEMSTMILDEIIQPQELG